MPDECILVHLPVTAPWKRVVTTLILVCILLRPATLRAQVAPRLERLPIAASLAELDFAVGNTPAMAIHSSGCVALFDQDASQVVCIDPLSAAVHRFGRSGAGPGEFKSVNAMVGTPDGGLLVFDVIGNLRFTLITKDWKLDRIVRASQQFQGLFRPTRDSVMTIGGTHGRELLAVSLKDGGVATHFAPAAADTALFVGPNPYDFFGFWPIPLHRGGWYLVSPWHYAVLAEDERGRVVSRFGRDVEREPLSEQELAAGKALLLKANPGRNLDALIERIRKTPKAVIQRAPVEDGKDRLWVITGRIRQDSTELDVFDPGGHFVGTRRVPGEAHALAVRDLDLYVLVEYTAGEHVGAQGVLRYRID